MLNVSSLRLVPQGFQMYVLSAGNERDGKSEDGNVLPVEKLPSQPPEQNREPIIWVTGAKHGERHAECDEYNTLYDIDDMRYNA